MNSKRGSAIVEATMVFPIVVIVVAAAISTGLKLYENVRAASFENVKLSAEMLDYSGLDTPDIIRGHWLIQ